MESNKDKYLKYKKKYLALKQNGNNLKGGALIKENYDFGLRFFKFFKSGPSLTITNLEKETTDNYNIVNEFNNGKSGDTVYLIEKDGSKYVIKLFNSNCINSNLHELNTHLKLNKYFRKTNSIYIPTPIIYEYGIVQNKNKLFYIMEALDNFELTKYIITSCESKIHDYDQLYKVLLQIFYIITRFKLLLLNHCDLHSDNIILIKNTGDPITLDFNHIGISDTFTINNNDYMIKVIDFGLSRESTFAKKTLMGVFSLNTININTCSKTRSLSSILDSLDKKCNKSSDKFKLMKEHVFGTKGDSDLNFFLFLLKIIYNSETPEYKNLMDLSSSFNKAQIDELNDIEELYKLKLQSFYGKLKVFLDNATMNAKNQNVAPQPPPIEQ